MAVKQPEEKNLQVLSPGTYRDAVRAELGAPISTGLTENSEEYDVFGFQEGNSKGWGVARAFLYGILDTFTLGAWEIIGTPIEGGISGGGRKNIRVVYKEKMVMRVEDLTPQPPPKTQ
ncbi:MAG: hypothetical protein HZB80_11655 [Deltaproteobacteria bacterium]|nr:hypothetical protein [Deltaproteobacteria bacterium]